jgi:hypothetical protein
MSFGLTRREKLIVLYVLISLIIGTGVKRWREHQREKQVVPIVEENHAAEFD